MPDWLLYLVVSVPFVGGWVFLGRAVARGELRLRGGGALRRAENPVAFWACIGGMLAGSLGAVVAIVMVVIPALRSAP